MEKLPTDPSAERVVLQRNVELYNAGLPPRILREGSTGLLTRATGIVYGPNGELDVGIEVLFLNGPEGAILGGDSHIFCVPNDSLKLLV